jgi:hypothetical protein
MYLIAEWARKKDLCRPNAYKFDIWNLKPFEVDHVHERADVRQ